MEPLYRLVELESSGLPWAWLDWQTSPMCLGVINRYITYYGMEITYFFNTKIMILEEKDMKLVLNELDCRKMRYLEVDKFS